MNNRRYTAYPKQRDLAQVFVRWALDHLTEEGVCGYNTSESWLKTKLADGAKETRRIIDKKLLEIVQDAAIKDYSEGKGGDIRTFIVVFGAFESQETVSYNSKHVMYNILQPDPFMEDAVQLSFENITLSTYTSRFPRIEGNKVGTNTLSMQRNIYYNEHGQVWQLFVKYQPKIIEPGLWKITNVDDFMIFAKNNLESRIRRLELNKDICLMLVGYLNTKFGISETQRMSAEANQGVRQLGSYGLRNIRVPDFDFYQQDRPERFQVYMTWIEANMRDKDVFLAGIDEQFKKLISD